VIRATRTGIVLGDVEVTWYDDATSQVALGWRRDRLTVLTATLHPGTCAEPGPALIGLRSLAPGEASSPTRLPIAGSSLQLGGFVVVVRDPDFSVVGCAELSR
jgi:hypothetical protein